MKITQLMAILFVFTISTTLHARKPAVEDFVGVETEGYKKTPKGTEVLFNFGENLTNTQVQDSSNYTDKFDVNTFSTFALIAFATLPFLMWFGIERSTRNQTLQSDIQTPHLNAESTTVKNLDDYRNEENKDDEDVKKVS